MIEYTTCNPINFLLANFSLKEPPHLLDNYKLDGRKSENMKIRWLSYWSGSCLIKIKPCWLTVSFNCFWLLGHAFLCDHYQVVVNLVFQEAICQTFGNFLGRQSLRGTTFVNLQETHSAYKLWKEEVRFEEKYEHNVWRKFLSKFGEEIKGSTWLSVWESFQNMDAQDLEGLIELISQGFLLSSLC